MSTSNNHRPMPVKSLRCLWNEGVAPTQVSCISCDDRRPPSWKVAIRLLNIGYPRSVIWISHNLPKAAVSSRIRLVLLAGREQVKPANTCWTLRARLNAALSHTRGCVNVCLLFLFVTRRRRGDQTSTVRQIILIHDLLHPAQRLPPTPVTL